MRKPLFLYLPVTPVRNGEPVSMSAATLPCDSTPRSVRATTDLQYVQTTTAEEPIANSIGAPQDGQFATLTCRSRMPLQRVTDRRHARALQSRPASRRDDSPTASRAEDGSNTD